MAFQIVAVAIMWQKERAAGGLPLVVRFIIVELVLTASFGVALSAVIAAR